MAELTVQNVVLAGVEKATLVAADANGDTFDNDGKTFLEVNNADATATTVTITGQKTLQAGTSVTKTVSVGNGKTFVIGPFPVGLFNTDSKQEVEIEYSKVVSLTVGVYSVNDKYN